MDLNNYILFWVCVIGLCLGSFYNVVIIRSLSGESIVFPPSKCPKCGNKLKAWHNIPLISYIFLRGKCYYCKEKISIQYPLIELLTMLLFGLTFWKFGPDLKTVFVLIWISALLIMTVTDLKEKLVDCNIAIFLVVTGIIYNFIYNGIEGVANSVSGLIAGVLILEIIARLGYVFAKKRSMGEADTYVAGSLGAIFGLKGVLNALLYSFGISFVFIIPIFLYKKFKSGDKLTLLFSLLFTLNIFVFEFWVQNIFTVFILIFFGAVLAYRILKTLNSEEQLNYLPFVPAFMLSALFCFWTLL